MRKLLCAFAVVLGVATCFLQSCIIDNCADISCVNGECVNGECDCETGYEGPDCSNEKTPDAIRVTKIIVEEFPATEPDGGSWDIGDGADIFVTFGVQDGAELYEASTYYENADPNLRYSFSANINLTNLADRHYIYLYDYDVTSANDYIDGVNFNLWSYLKGKGFPKTTDLIRYSGGKASFTLEVDYTFN